MPLYTPAEFARFVGKTPAYLKVYTNRGKLLKSGDYYDSEVRENAEMILKWSKEPRKEPKPKPQKERKAKDPKPKKEAKKLKFAPPERPQTKVKELGEISSPQPDVGGVYDLDLKKKQAEIENKEANTRVLMLKEAKMRGEQIPVDLVKNMVSELSRSIITSYKDSADALLIEISHRTKMKKEDSASLKGELVNLINKAHDTAIDKALATITTVIDEVKFIELDEDEQT